MKYKLCTSEIKDCNRRNTRQNRHSPGDTSEMGNSRLWGPPKRKNRRTKQKTEANKEEGYSKSANIHITGILDKEKYLKKKEDLYFCVCLKFQG